MTCRLRLGGCLAGRVWLSGGLCGVSETPGVGLAMRFRSRRQRWRSSQAGLTLISRSRVSSAAAPSYGPGVRGKIPRRPRRPRLVLTSVAAHVRAVPAHARSTGWPVASWTRRAKPLQSREPRAGTGWGLGGDAKVGWGEVL